MNAREYRGLTLRYECDRSALTPELSARFLAFDLDDDGRAWIDHAIENRHGRGRTLARRWLTGFVSDFDANGMLGMYPMHLLTNAQWRRLLGVAPERRHLDVGAGSGDVTHVLAPLSGETVTTEVSWAMARKLERRGFNCVRADIVKNGVPLPPYGLITCLNVLDRCAQPRTLLEKLLEGLDENGLLVVATPLPFDAFFYDGPQTREPRERLDVSGDTWEQAMVAFAHGVIEPLGVCVQSVTRAPYLSGGDAGRPMYVLDDAVFVCRRLSGPADES